MNAGPSVRETVQSAYVQRGSMTMTMTPFLEEPPVLLKREQRRRDPSNGVIHQGSPSGKGMAGLETQMDARQEMPEAPEERWTLTSPHGKGKENS